MPNLGLNLWFGDTCLKDPPHGGIEGPWLAMVKIVLNESSPIIEILSCDWSDISIWFYYQTYVKGKSWDLLTS